ncbi:hypothetical protein QBC46DRAFT_413761 [Diplogelasinospora grovesii]|uniref:Uncharacterized protein n=1 Tax=Diplogelasinospora grovesii TaxID=303347 RepID=A0AAN6MW69_9PEZI|nr:hypothetical protein QBC46DRAFT_413761 [Diplogelasinospora grovesii]
MTYIVDGCLDWIEYIGAARLESAVEHDPYLHILSPDQWRWLESFCSEDIRHGINVQLGVPWYRRRHTNFNPWVAGTQGTASVSASTSAISDQVCVMGTGANYYTNEGFSGICAVTCEYGYCPPGACMCQQLGRQKTYPSATGVAGYAKYDQNFIGLCSWTCNYGFSDLFTTECTTTETTAPVLDWSPFLPPVCTAGEINSDSECTCTATGLLVALPKEVNTYTSDIDAVYPDDGNFWATQLCDWPCENVGLCPCDYPQSNFTCDVTSTSDLDAIEGLSQERDMYCNGLDVLDWLAANMTAVLDGYNTIVSGGYDSYFSDYVSYIQGSVNSSIESFMAANGTEYFSCSGTSLSYINTDTSGGCPAWSSLSASEDAEDITLAWTLADSDGFYAVLEAVWGVNSSWVTFGTYTFGYSCPPEQCGEAAWRWTFTGYPTSVATDDITVYNPQSVFTSATNGLTDLPTSIYATYLDFVFGQWGNGSIIDAVQVYQTAVSSAAQALVAMDQVETLAKEIEAAESAAKQKEMIMWIVTAALSFVPFVGEEVATAVDLASLARALSMVSTACSFIHPHHMAPNTALGRTPGTPRFVLGR